MCSLVTYIKAGIEENDLLGQLTAWLQDTRQGARTVGFIVVDITFIIQCSLPFCLAKPQAFFGKRPDSDFLPPLWPQRWVPWLNSGKAGDGFSCRLWLWLDLSEYSPGLFCQRKMGKFFFSLEFLSWSDMTLGLPVAIQHKTFYRIKSYRGKQG